ncbi:MAG: YjfB family protein [Betaproteobacteria bacterium]
MNLNSVGSTLSAVSQASTGDAVAISVLKKALEVQAQGAMQLIQALPLPSTNSPAHLGNNVNTFA